MEEFTTIDEYIALFEPAVQERLQSLRECIHAVAQCEERVSWRMPTFYLKGNLVHFAAHKAHIGFYPGASGISHFAPRFDEMELKYSKGAVQFPNSQPLPLALVEEITRFRVAENMAEK